MINTKVTVVGNCLEIKVDLSKSSGLSKSGKSTTIASSGGFCKVEGTDVTFNLNVVKPLKISP